MADEMSVYLVKVTDAIVLMDREQGGVEMLASQGIRLHPIISMFKLLNVLLAAERVDAQTAQSVRKFILDNNTFRYSSVAFSLKCSTMAGRVRVFVCVFFNAYSPCASSKVTFTTCLFQPQGGERQ